MNKNREKISKRRETLEAYTFVGPYVIGIVLFFLFPICFSLAISFCDFKVVAAGNTFDWVGLTNYINIFVEDAAYSDAFIKSISTTIINTILIVVFSLVIAVVLNKKMVGQGFFRTVFFLPFLLGTGYVMNQLLGVGTVDQAMSMARSIVLPDEIKAYLGADLSALLMGFLGKITWIFWRSGVQVILFLAGLQGINKSLYESARIDSATEWEIFWKITIPMVSPTTLLIIVYSIIDSFTDPTNPLGEMFMHKAFQKTEYSISAAMSWVYFLFIMAMVGIVFVVMKRFIHSDFDKK
ncbi:MAG: sugar ABC transporter permease [Oscillospiraceae bacterium]